MTSLYFSAVSDAVAIRRISDFKLLKWIPRLNPVFDAYFAPLKNKHHYWFGVLLIVRGVLLVVFTAT